jgi:hypothetical protein
MKGFAGGAGRCCPGGCGARAALSAGVLSDRVVASVLGRPDGRFISRERALDPRHFEFRGSEARPPAGPRRREDS